MIYSIYNFFIKFIINPIFPMKADDTFIASDYVRPVFKLLSISES